MDYLERFKNWMIIKGRIISGRPTNPLSEKTANTNLTVVRRVLIDLEYVKKIGNGDNRVGHIKNEYLTYSPGRKHLKHIRDLSVEELENYFDNNPIFNPVTDRKVRGKKALYIFATWKFAEFLTYELGYWKKSKLDKLKKKVSPPSVKYQDFEIIDPDLVDQFLRYLKDQNFKLYAMLFVSRWLGGMRFIEIINIKPDFQGGSLIIDNFKKNTHAKIWGKGEAGLGKPRLATLLPQVKEVLLKIKKINEESFEENPDWLFCNRYGDQYCQLTSNINRDLKKYAKKSGLFNDSEIDKFKFHSLGRHTFGTYYYDKIPPKLLMKEMGIEDHKTLERYINISLSRRTDIVTKASSGNGFEYESEVEENNGSDKVGLIRELLGELSKEEKVKLLTEIL